MLKKQKRIVQKVKSKYWACTHKNGIHIPKNIREAIEIDKENCNTLWMDAVKLEMKNVQVAFKNTKETQKFWSVIPRQQVILYSMSNLEKTSEGKRERDIVPMATRPVHLHQ